MGKRIIDADALIEIIRARRQRMKDMRKAGEDIVGNYYRELEASYYIALIDAAAEEVEV